MVFLSQPDLADGDDEAIKFDILGLQKKLFEQVSFSALISKLYIAYLQ